MLNSRIILIIQTDNLWPVKFRLERRVWFLVPLKSSVVDTAGERRKQRQWPSWHHPIINSFSININSNIKGTSCREIKAKMKAKWSPCRATNFKMMSQLAAFVHFRRLSWLLFTLKLINWLIEKDVLLVLNHEQKKSSKPHSDIIHIYLKNWREVWKGHRRLLRRLTK